VKYTPRKIEDRDREPMHEHTAFSLENGMTPDEVADGLQLLTYPKKPPYTGYLKYKVWPDGVEWRAIYVREEYRQLGIGWSLIKRMEKVAKELKKDWLYVRVGTDGKSDVTGRFISGMGGWKPIASEEEKRRIKEAFGAGEMFTWRKKLRYGRRK
jgi:GNAT superfamily N-acetyltransferase